VLEPGTLSLDCGEQGRFKLETMHPALMRPGNFKEDDFDTRLVFLGKGGSRGLAGARGISLEGTIAVMDYDCGDEWLGLLRFGFEGFIFVGNGKYAYRQAATKIYNSEVSIPRFFIDGEAGQKLRELCENEREVSAQASAVPTRWKNGSLRDLWVIVPGADEELAKQIVVFTAPMDANSVVPSRAHGAQRAVNLHVLLKLLETLKTDQPGYTVVLAAVNAHTRRYQGERMLSWQLLADEKRVEKLRDEIAGEMRIARLYSTEYGKLKLLPVNDSEKVDLHVMMEVMWRLDEDQQEIRKEEHKKALQERETEIERLRKSGEDVAELEESPLPNLDEVLDLSVFGEEDVRLAIAEARKEIMDGYESFFAKRGKDPAELEEEKKEDTDILDALENVTFDEFMVKAGRIKHVFDDEKLFEAWRSKLDESTGRRVYVKGKLQDEFKSSLNRTMQEIMVMSSTNLSDVSAEVRETRIAELSVDRDNLRRVLVLFNKMDLGVGRSRTYYRQIAVNDVQRTQLKNAVERFVSKYAKWQELHAARLEKDVANGAIRHAVGTKKVSLVVPLELDAHGGRYGFSYHALNANATGMDGFGKICAEIADAIDAEPDGIDTNVFRYIDAISAATDKKPAHFFSLPESPALYFQSAAQTPAVALKSAFTGKGSLFGPDDVAGRIDPVQVDTLERSVLRFLCAMLQHEEILSVKNLKPMAGAGKNLWSVLARTYSLEQFSGKPIPTTDIPGCFVTMYNRSYPPFVQPSLVNGDVLNCYMGISDDTAHALVYGIGEYGRYARLAPLAYRMDEECRDVLYTIDKGRVQSSKQINSNVQLSDRVTLPMFECREFVIKDRLDPTLLSASQVNVFKYWPKTGDGKSDPDKYGVHGSWCLSPSWSHVASGPVGIYLYRKTKGFIEDSLMVITDKKRCVLNATEEEPEGLGFQTQDDLGSDFFGRAANDMAELNKSRGSEMKGVVNQLLDEFIESGDLLNAEAAKSKAANEHLEYVAKNYEALGSEVKAYGEIQKMNADMLKAVIVYMALMLPFCFFTQKLLFNFKTLERELAGFSVLFVSMYVLFRFIHPAFRIAMNPEAIFIAFVLGAIGVFTTSVLRARFSGEMQILLRGIGGIGEEASYGTVGQTAMLIGVQNMRRRRVRTTLTTATIVLVVFTMLAFSSVSRKAKPTLIAKSDAAPYTGLFYHWPGGKTMDERSVSVFRDLFAGRGEVQVRRLLKRTDPWRMELVSDPDAVLEILAVNGLPPGDVAVRDSMAIVEGEDFSSPWAEEVLLPVTAADALDIGIRDVGVARVRFLGRELVVRGLVNDQRYCSARDLNPNLPLVPMTAPRQTKREDRDSLEIEDKEIGKLMMDTAQLAIIPEGLAAELGALPNSVSVVLPPGATDGGMGREIGRVLKVTEAKFYVGSREPFKPTDDAISPVKAGIYYVGSSYRTAIGGLAKLIIPLIIAGSIILNTMLGTVYERKSEIAVFNAIGLNPTHIFLFFLAEATVYSFIGSVGGYLIGQVLTVALKSAGMISDVNINFSSLMVVYAILFTMALVILSTIYPGYVATRTAVPSGKRKWSMPDNDGNTMNVVFPFIYQPRLALGVMYYVREFFEPLSEQSSGDLIAELKEADEEKDDAGRPVYSLSYALALAPYDLGVTQKVTFTTRYDEIVQSFRLHMDVERVSGRDTNWVTTNKPFLERMRKLLIRWRNIDPTRQAWFERKAAAMYGHAVEEESDKSGNLKSEISNLKSPDTDDSPLITDNRPPITE